MDERDEMPDGFRGAAAAAHFLPQVYKELRRLASSYLQREGAYHTLEPTALVHEAYLRMAKIEEIAWSGRTHFFAMAATQMRRVLVEHARAATTQKRGDGAERVTLQEDSALTPERNVEVLAVDQALSNLARESPRQARVAEMRLFAGMLVPEAAQALGISERTVKGDWRVARAWLARELSRTEGE